MRISDWSSDVCSSDLISQYRAMQKHWFQSRLRQLGKTQRGLAKHMGLDPSRVTEILNKSRGIKIEEAVEMADYLATSLDDLVTRLGSAVARGVRASSLVVGYVGAGETVLSIARSEGRRVGQECVRKVRSRWSQD